MGLLTKYVSYLWYSTVDKSWQILHMMLKQTRQNGVFLDLGCSDGTGTMLFAKDTAPQKIMALK